MAISGGEIAFLVISMLILAAIFLTKSKAHAGDNRIRPRRERMKDMERDRQRRE